MLKKAIFSLLLACLCTSSSISQRFMQSAGTTISFLYDKNKTNNPSANLSVTPTTFTYFPRYNFVENENSSFSIGTPVGLGVGLATDVYGDNWSVSFAYDLGAAFDYNIGCKSTRANPKSFGGYLGAGFSYLHVGVSNNAFSEFRGNTYGPLVRGGLRFLFSKGRNAGSALNTGLFYKRGLEAAKVSTIGLNVLWDM